MFSLFFAYQAEIIQLLRFPENIIAAYVIRLEKSINNSFSPNLTWGVYVC